MLCGCEFGQGTECVLRKEKNSFPLGDTPDQPQSTFMSKGFKALKSCM